ncbi:MAG: efflux RND transporter periplasmic adaptor subunit [Ktedonobacteraceae bacterium]|nr:efflux RND transporter periplasmic adaptor subunit [Ktedonobacteraceae bacterium]
MRRLILIPVLIVLALFAIAGGIAYLLYNNYMYYSTDDAQLTGNVIPVNAIASGQLTTLNVALGDNVTAGQTLATITPAPGAGATGAPTNAKPIDITSPINGKVIQTSAVTGQTVVPGLALVELADLNSITVTSYVAESSINDIKVGQDVDIKIDAYSDTNFSGKVQQIIPAAASTFSLLPTQDNASGNFTKVGQRIPVVITLDGNGGKTLAPGMSATTTIHIH